MLMRRGHPDERGAVAIIVGITVTILFVTAALVVDLGLARDTKRQSQNAADASSLAAANVLYPKSGLCVLDPAPGVPPCYADAVDAATTYAETNFGVEDSEWSSCSDDEAFYVPPGSTQCVSFTDESETALQVDQPTRIRVLIPQRETPVGLGSLAGISEIQIATTARAALDPGSARSCGLCLLGTGTSSLGNADVTVSGGNVHSNGTVDTGPMGGLAAAPAPNAITTSGTCPGNCTPTPDVNVPPIDDPYAEVVSFPLPFTNTPKSTPCTQGPGVYGALELPNSVCTLTPGTYVLTGMWTMKNNTVLRGTGVTLYGTCGTTSAPAVCPASGQNGGGLDGKNGETQLVAPTTGPLAGLVVVYDPRNTSGLNLQGNGLSAVTGAVYAASATLEFPGNSSFSVTNGPIIVGGLYGNGNTGGINLISAVGASIPSPPEGVRLDQ